jgi:hypothetical protein
MNTSNNDPPSNHPFIIFIKARQHGLRVPLTFLQKAHKSGLIYASWVAKNLTDMQSAQLDVLDPFLAYLVGIAASIHLEHSLSSNTTIAASAKQKLTTCMAYLIRVSHVWPRVRMRIAALKRLQARVGDRSALHYVEDEYDGAVPVQNVRHVSLSEEDERLMWTLFDSSNDPVPGTLPSENVRTGSDIEQLNIIDLSPDTSASTVENSVYQDGSAQQTHSFNGIARSSHHNTSVVDLPLLTDDPDADWSLLGMPWLAYFPSDKDLLVT